MQKEAVAVGVRGSADEAYRSQEAKLAASLRYQIPFAEAHALAHAPCRCTAFGGLFKDKMVNHKQCKLRNRLGAPLLYPYDWKQYLAELGDTPKTAMLHFGLPENSTSTPMRKSLTFDEVVQALRKHKAHSAADIVY